MDLRVKVADKIERRDFTDEVELNRAARAGQTGQIISQKTGHGLCYAVHFSDNGIAWFDPDELQLTR